MNKWLAIVGLTAFFLLIAATYGIIFEVVFPDAASWEKLIGALVIGGLFGGVLAFCSEAHQATREPQL